MPERQNNDRNPNRRVSRKRRRYHDEDGLGPRKSARLMPEDLPDIQSLLEELQGLEKTCVEIRKEVEEYNKVVDLFTPGNAEGQTDQ